MLQLRLKDICIHETGGEYPPSGTWDLGYLPPPVPTPSGGHQNTYGWQAGGTHPTGMFNCLMIFFFVQVCYQDTSYVYYVAGSASTATWASSSDGSGDLAVTVTQTDTDQIQRCNDMFSF